MWEGGRELDCRIAYAVGMDWCDPAWAYSGTSSWRDHIYKFGYDGAWNNDHVYGREDGVPHFTTSLDAGRFLHYKVLPHHDFLSLDSDPSGFGCEIGNWFLGENVLVNYGKSSCATLELAYIAAILQALHSKVSGEESIKRMGEPTYMP